MKNVKIVEKFKYLIFISAAILLAGIIFAIVSFATGGNGLNLGIDFTGGATIEIDADSEITQADKDAVLKMLNDGGFKVNGEIQSSPATDGGMTYEIRLSYVYEGKRVDNQEVFMEHVQGDLSDDSNNGICGEIQTYFGDRLEDGAVKAHAVGETASNALISSAILATVVAIVVMLIYIIIRFTFTSALAAVCALAHDVIMMVALTAIFGVTVNSTFIAAIITIIGYSINASIVIFDRVREERKIADSTGRTIEEIANYSIASTFRVNALSTLTTFIMVFFLVILSVSTISEFILPIIFGLVSGLFSANVVAPSLWVKFRKIADKVEAKRKEKKGGYVGATKQDA